MSNDDNRLQLYMKQLGDWTIGDVIGHGGAGSVYKLRRRTLDLEETEVLKVINIIEEDIGLDEMSETYRNDYLKREQDAVRKALSEVKLMDALKNCSNVVTYQDFRPVEVRQPNCTATDLLIRMHEYKPLNKMLNKREAPISQKEVVSIGIDICTALEGCAQNSIIHRDIKPDNIFFNGNKYLLGDFGISKILEGGAVAKTNNGTMPYISPEQFGIIKTERGYDGRVDIYSLGLTLYTLANKGQLPFYAELHNMDSAITKRLMNTPIPRIAGICDGLNDIILRACQFYPQNRYQNPTDMKKALEALDENMQSIGTRPVMGTRGAMSGYATQPALGNPSAMSSYATQSALGTPNAMSGYATQPALGNPNAMSGYATQPALGTPNAMLGYATQPALGTPNAMSGYATQSALGTPNAMSGYATQPALGNPNAMSGYATQPALGNPGAMSGYATEAALGNPGAMSGYATEAALGNPGAMSGYATEAALGNPGAMSGYATEAALGNPSVMSGYATEAALGNPMAMSGYATEAALGNPGAMSGYATEAALGNPVAAFNQGVRMQPVARVSVPGYAPQITPATPHVKEEAVQNTKETAVDYFEVAIKQMKAGNREEAFAAFETLAEKEGYEVMYNEVTKYFSNETMISNHADDAVYWFEKCVQNCRDSWTISLAEFQLGEIYSKGLGVKKNHKIAEKYYASSAAKGNMYAKKKFVAGKYVK